VLAFAASAATYLWLPDRMPTHFDLAGHPDGYSSRTFGAFLLPVFMLAIVVLARRPNRALQMACAIVSAFALALHVLVLRAALSGGGLGDVFWLVAGVFFVAIGLVLPRLPHNRWVGVRTPWSMRSPEVWARSQRAGGYALVAAGVLVMISCTMTGSVALALRGVAIVGAGAVSIVYSYIAAKKLEEA